MKYIITANKRKIAQARNIFEQSYSIFLHEKCNDTFDQVVESALCGSMIFEDERLIAFCFHREMSCPDWKNPPQYLSDTPDTFRKHIANRLKMLTIEWLTVAPEYLGKFTKVQPADLILGSALTLMKNSIFNASMGYSRQDLKIDQMTTRFGTRLFGTVDRFGIPCSVVLVEDIELKNHPISKVQDKINELWTNRISDVPNLERKKVA